MVNAPYFNTTKLIKYFTNSFIKNKHTFSLTLNKVLKSVIFQLFKLKIDYQCNLNPNPSKLFCGYCQTDSKVYVER